MHDHIRLLPLTMHRLLPLSMDGSMVGHIQSSLLSRLAFLRAKSWLAWEDANAQLLCVDHRLLHVVVVYVDELLLILVEAVVPGEHLACQVGGGAVGCRQQW